LPRISGALLLLGRAAPTRKSTVDPNPTVEHLF
jgi:hypothetical protein